MEQQIKDLTFGSAAKYSLLSGVDKMVSSVGSTLGAKGRTVIIESVNTTSGVQITKDGVTVADSIVLENPVENIAASILKQASKRTAKDAGDGTTTSIILAGAIVRNGLTEIANGGISEIEMIRGLRELADNFVIPKIKEAAMPIDTPSRLRDVAIISSNNDTKIGGLIADVFESAGENGIVTAERGDGFKTTGLIVNGARVKRGVASPVFINDHGRDVCSFVNGAYVFLSSTEINSLLTIESLLLHAFNKKKPLVIIAPCSQNVINTVSANVMKQDRKLCIISPPAMGWRSHEMMDDLALLFGAKHFSEKTGDDLSIATPDDLGIVDTVTASREETTFLIGDVAAAESRTKERVGQLKARKDDPATDESERKFIDERISLLVGRAGVILAGGQTDVEMKEVLDRIDDAVCAVNSARVMGVVPGGGVCLNDIANDMMMVADKYNSSVVSVMCSALSAPMDKILENAGMNELDYDYEKGQGINVLTGEKCNMVESGIIDPAKVTLSAFENAMSVATTILSTSTVITYTRA